MLILPMPYTLVVYLCSVAGSRQVTSLMEDKIDIWGDHQKIKRRDQRGCDSSLSLQQICIISPLPVAPLSSQARSKQKE